MSYPTPPQAQPTWTPPEPPKKSRRWLMPTIVGVLTLAIGLGIGSTTKGGTTEAAAATPAASTVTATATAPAPPAKTVTAAPKTVTETETADPTAPQECLDVADDAEDLDGALDELATLASDAVEPVFEHDVAAMKENTEKTKALGERVADIRTKLYADQAKCRSLS